MATAAPPIAAELEGFESISWIFSVYMLASTVMTLLLALFMPVIRLRKTNGPVTTE